MQSFRTEIENPAVEKDIIELEKKIRLFREGRIDEEKFRSLRLARGVYGQRQPGVQMIRIKLPYGKMTVNQLLRIADVSDEYSTGKLHLTTRQDIQIHYVSLDRTPEMWAELEKDSVTIREACGNTVRNVTASPTAGIDPKEPFDVTPYAHAFFEYFLRRPFNQELGRKFKIALSSSEDDTALVYLHDLGLIPRVQQVNGKEVRGFKVVIGGGLGAQPVHAVTAHEFLEEDKVIPFTEAVLRVFDRHGERTRRLKARIKYLITDIGPERFLELVEKEKPALTHRSYPIDHTRVPAPVPPAAVPPAQAAIKDSAKYAAWLKSNVSGQKQKGFFAVQVKVTLGNLSTATARKFAGIVREYAADDIRITVNQGFLLRFVREEALPSVFRRLDEILFAEPGFDGAGDIIACPGTDTCNLGISNSTSAALALEKVINEEYGDLIYNRDLKIRISGCMNSCGQHGMAGIGFHGSSFRHGEYVVPALQVLLGGATLGGGNGRFGDKIIKVPSRRAPALLRAILDDYEKNGQENELFHVYYDRQGKDYFYELLKEFSNKDTVTEAELIDWGQNENYVQAVGVGECAGVVIDLVQTLFFESEEKLEWAKESLEAKAWADSIYHSYSAMVNGAKALLLGRGVKCNTLAGIVSDFDKSFTDSGEVKVEGGSFSRLAGLISANPPSEKFAGEYFTSAQGFLESLKTIRQKQTSDAEAVN